MLQQTLAEQGHEKLGANRFGVMTQCIPVVTECILVVTRTRLLNINYVATLLKYVTT